MSDLLAVAVIYDFSGDRRRYPHYDVIADTGDEAVDSI